MNETSVRMKKCCLWKSLIHTKNLNVFTNQKPLMGLSQHGISKLRSEFPEQTTGSINNEILYKLIVNAFTIWACNFHRISLGMWKLTNVQASEGLQQFLRNKFNVVLCIFVTQSQCFVIQLSCLLRENDEGSRKDAHFCIIRVQVRIGFSKVPKWLYQVLTKYNH